MFDNTDSWHPPAQGVRPTLMPSCQSRMFIQIWTQPRPEKVSTPAAAFLPGLVSIMNTFWFYGIIQIHYDACQIIARVHVKKLVKITIKANNAFNAQQKKFIEYGENIKINFARPGGRENECCSYVMLCSGAGSSAAQMKTSYACQDTRLDLRCPAGEVIKVGTKILLQQKIFVYHKNICYPGDARQLRPLQRGHLQRARHHGLERQLHGAQEPPHPAGQVHTAEHCRTLKILQKLVKNMKN